LGQVTVWTLLGLSSFCLEFSLNGFCQGINTESLSLSLCLTLQRRTLSRSTHKTAVRRTLSSAQVSAVLTLMNSYNTSRCAPWIT
jgi:hypothetical protein